MGTLITIDSADAAAVAAACDQATACLAAGGVALLPAEGLYGLHACLAVPSGPARLRALKGGAGARPYILLVPDRAAARALIDPSAPAAAAAERWWQTAWPGPVTFVMPAGPRVPGDLARAGQVALRCPGSTLLRAVAARLSGPLLSTSANPSGGRAPARLTEVAPELMAACELVVDAGPLSGQGSTVVRVEADGRLTTLRPGAWAVPAG